MTTNIKKRELFLVIASFLLPLALQISLLIHQYTKAKVISFWSIVATVVLLLIFLNAVRMNIWPKNPNEEGIDNQNVSTVKPAKKMSKKTKIVFSCIMAVLFGLSALFFNIHSNKVKGLMVVDSEVIWQEGRVVKDREVNEGEVTETEYREIRVLVKYSFNGTDKIALLEGNTIDKLTVNELKVYVNEAGECVTDYGRILIWKIVAIICLACAILILLSLILKFGMELSAGAIMCSIGLVLMFVVGCQFIENMIFNDLVCFTSMFANAGLSILVYSVLNKIFPGKAMGLSESQEIIPAVHEVLEKEHVAESCTYCGSELLPNANFCENCGAKISKNEE